MQIYFKRSVLCSKLTSELTRTPRSDSDDHEDAHRAVDEHDHKAQEEVERLRQRPHEHRQYAVVVHNRQCLKQHDK